MAPLKIGVLGCAGRMGQTLVRAIVAAPDLALAGAAEKPGSEWLVFMRSHPHSRDRIAAIRKQLEENGDL